MWCAVMLLFVFSFLVEAEEFPLEKTLVNQPYLEWVVPGPDKGFDSYDLEAFVTFTHSESGSSVYAPLYYAGEGIFKFRFTPRRQGLWSFETRSSEPELAGHSGAVLAEYGKHDHDLTLKISGAGKGAGLSLYLSWSCTETGSGAFIEMNR